MRCQIHKNMDLSTERLSNENFDFTLTKDNELDENLKKN